MVKVSVANLDFGLIQFGQSAALKFDLINESHTTATFQLQKLVKEKKMFIVSVCVCVHVIHGCDSGGTSHALASLESKRVVHAALD